MFLIDFSRYFSQRRRFLPPGAFTFPSSSFHFFFLYLFVLPHYKYNVNKKKNKKKTKKIDVTMARRPQENYEAYIN